MEHEHSPAPEELGKIRTQPGLTSGGKPFSWLVDQQAA